MSGTVSDTLKAVVRSVLGPNLLSASQISLGMGKALLMGSLDCTQAWIESQLLSGQRTAF